MSVRLHFNERKATQAAAHLLKRRGGRMSYLKLIKLLYLADREALFRLGRPITTDRYVSMNRGPVLSRILELVSDGEDPDAPSIWSSTIGPPSNYEVELIREAEGDELSEAETEILNEIFDEHGRKSRWELVDLAHHLPEWKNPNGSATPLSYRDILIASGKSELEASAIEDELAELSQASALLTES